MEALELQADLVARSKFDEQRFIRGAGRDIQLDNPLAVTNAVHEYWSAPARNKIEWQQRPMSTVSLSVDSPGKQPLQRH
jgi:hypothetical protein